MSPKGEIRIERIGKTFGTMRAVKDVDLLIDCTSSAPTPGTENSVPAILRA